MIIIDGRSTDLKVGNFANLEEILVNMLEDECMQERIVTDVFVNDESFSELYPHQAEDIDASEIDKVEIRSVTMTQMASDITTELYKVVSLMMVGGKRIAGMMREYEIGSALDVLQDVLDVTRNFLGTLALLRSEFSINREDELAPMTERLGELLDEINDVVEQEDWMLMADLIEYEFLPSCEAWNSVLNNLAADIAQSKAA